MNKTLSWGGFLVLSVAFFYLPWSKFGFIDDDFGDAYRIQQADLASIKDMFFGKTILNQIVAPSRIQEVQTVNAFTVYYRPLWHALSVLQGKIIGISARSALFINAVTHGVNATLLTLFLTRLSSPIVAIGGGLYFLMHPALKLWFGRLSSEQYPLNLFLILLFVFCLLAWFERKNVLWFSAAAVLFTSSLFVRETAILLPAWVLIGVLIRRFYERKTIDWYYENQWLAGSLFLCAISVLYVMWRVWLFGLSSGEQSFITTIVVSPHLFVRRMVVQWISWLVDSCGLGFLPVGSGVIKLALLGLIAVSVLVLFIRSSQKLLTIWLVLGFLAMSWPSLLFTHFPAYIYEGLGFLIAAVAMMSKELSERRVLLAGLIISVLLINTTFLINTMHRRTQLTHTVTTALQSIASDPKIQNAGAVVFLGMPRMGFAVSGLRQALYFYNQNWRKPVFADGCTTVFDDVFYKDGIQLIKNNGVYVDVHGDEVHISCAMQQPQSWIPISAANNPAGKSGIGLYRVLKSDGDRTFELELTIRPEIMALNPCFITWNSNVLRCVPVC